MSTVRCKIPLVPIVLALIPALSMSQNMGFLKDSAVSYFDDKDIAMMMQNLDDALNDERVPATREWKNSASGNFGKAEVLSASKKSDAMPCKRVRFFNQAHNGVTGGSAYTFCKHAEKWMIESKGSK